MTVTPIRSNTFAAGAAGIRLRLRIVPVFRS